MRTTILPCPFCFSSASVVKAHENCMENPYVVVCDNETCSASVGIFSKTREEAISKWNTRKVQNSSKIEISDINNLEARK